MRRIRTKLIAGFTVVIALMVSLSLYIACLSQKSLRQSVGESSIFVAEEMLRRINHNIYQKIEAIQTHSTELFVKETLSQSNREFEKLDDIRGYINRQDEKWTSVPQDQTTPFMQGLIGNKLSDRLRQHIIQFYEKKYGYRAFEEVFVTNRFGANIAQSSKTTGYGQDDEKWFQVTKQKGLYISDVERDKSFGTCGIIIGIGINDEEGNFLGALKAVISVKEVIREAEVATKKYQATSTILLTKEGYIIYRTRAFKFMEKLPNKNLLKEIQNQRGFFTAEDGGMERLFSYARSKGYREFKGLGWILMVGHDLKEVLKPAFALRNTIMASSLVIIIISTTVALLISRSITKPVAKLSKGAEIIGKGDLKHTVELESKDEIGELAVAFNQMTERRRVAEEALRDEITRRRILFEQSRDGIVVLDQNGKAYETNQRFAEMLGYSTKEVLQLHMWDWDTQFPKEQLLEMVRTVDDAGDHFQTRHRRKDGTFYDVEISSNGVVYGGQKLILCICRDITERKQAEEKIKEYADNLEKRVEARTKDLNQALYDTEEARDKIDGILKSIADGLIVTNVCNKIVLMNRAAENFLGIRFSEVINRPIDFAIRDETLRDRIKHTLEKTEAGYEFDFELPGENTGHNCTMRARTSMIEDRNGKHTGIITIIHDVTHEREVDRMKTEFISTAAHELRTPLTSIQGFSEILLTRDNINKESKKKYLTYINKQSVNLANIINDLLDISRIESEKSFTLKKEWCAVGEVIKEIIPYFEDQCPKHRFEVSVTDKDLKLYVDKEKMEQVLKNIISNAVKYSPQGGLIRVTGGIKKNCYQISIEDQGIGMTPDQMDKIFDKFYRADASNTAVQGTGLGMSIVKYLVEAHGGEVRVESKLGKGTTVSFKIPTQDFGA